ncbi:MAG: OadG family protein [Clostridia bacterium]|nr:OadG family protein [Clostridia bacterium]
MNILSLLAINTENVMKALEIMWKGVVAIFIVIALIIIVTKIVNKVCVSAETKHKERKEKETEQNQPKP